MKTLHYILKINEDYFETLEEWYRSTLKMLVSYSLDNKLSRIKDSDLVIYPLNFETILSEKYILLSANNNAYNHLDELADKLERSLRYREIKFTKKIKEIK